MASAAMSEEKSNFAENRQRGRVKNVCKAFLIKADENLAYRLQNEEYFEHYNKNRKNTQGIRVDLPVAKCIQQSEYQELLKRHQMLEKLEQEDMRLAQEIQMKLMDETLQQTMTDQELARQLQLQENGVSSPPKIAISSLPKSNEKILSGTVSTNLAKDLRKLKLHVNKMFIEDTEDEDEIVRVKREQEDLRLAKYLQEQEKKALMEKSQSKHLMNDEQLAKLLQSEETHHFQKNSTKQRVMIPRIDDHQQNKSFEAAPSSRQREEGPFLNEGDHRKPATVDLSKRRVRREKSSNSTMSRLNKIFHK